MPTLACGSAHAHVKWFADWSVILCPPRDPLRVLNAPLWQAFFAAAIVCMALLAWVDARLRAPVGGLLNVARIRRQAVHDAVMPQAMLMLRVGLSAYWLMVSLTLATPVYLTPELAAPQWVRWLQMACAVAVLSRSTCWLAGLGLITMYGLATLHHGWFHLLDYPLFLVIGIVLLLPEGDRHAADALGLDLLPSDTPPHALDAARRSAQCADAWRAIPHRPARPVGALFWLAHALPAQRHARAGGRIAGACRTGTATGHAGPRANAWPVRGVGMLSRYKLACCHFAQ